MAKTPTPTPTPSNTRIAPSNPRIAPSNPRIAPSSMPTPTPSNPRIAQLERLIAEKSANDKSTGATKRKLRYAKMALELMSIVKQSDVTPETWETLESLTKEYTPPTSVTVTKGMTLVQLFQQYGNVKDAYKKALKAAEKAGLKLVGDHFE